MTPKHVAVLLAALPSTALLAQHPIVPGVQRLREHASSSPAERGATLLGELSCTACHRPKAASEHLSQRHAPDLRGVHSRVTTTWLERFLLDPHGSKPGTLMPRWQPAADAATRREQADLLLHYLASRSQPLPASKSIVNDHKVEVGRKLYHSVGCVACHAPEDQRKTVVGSVPLGELARKTTVEALTAFLLDPKKVRPASRMPNLWLKKDEADAIARFLLRDQAKNPQATQAKPPEHSGLFYEFFEIDSNEMPDFEQVQAKANGFVASVTNRIEQLPRKRRYALRFRGQIKAPADGAYTFYLRSRGPSRLLINGDVVVTDGVGERSGLEELTKGKHDIEIEYYHFKGRKQELSAHWQVPGARKRPIPANQFVNRRGRAMIPLESSAQPFAVDPAKAARGKALFAELRCNACHEPETKVRSATALDDLDITKAGGCLDDQPKGTAVQYQLHPAQRADLRAALKDKSWAAAPDAKSKVRRQFAAFNCYACHARDGIGGPESARDGLFATKISIDLGDEGRLPPPLTGVGDKLRTEALRDIISAGKHHIRGAFMKTRMPGFEADTTKQLVSSLVKADRLADTRKPKFSVEAVEVGRKIVGITGFACVTCHNVNGGLSASIPGVDIATAAQRLRPAWFHRYLFNPPKYREGTRMPAFWANEESPFTDMLGGSSSKQIDAIWSYLSLGKSMPVPKGLKKDDGRPKMELIPSTEPIVHRTFMKDVSQRAILVGFPENVHVVFDAQAVRLAKAWRGRFFDASGVASGRTQNQFGPLGGEELLLPGTAFAALAKADTPWPSHDKNARDVGGDFRGYSFDAKMRPVFRYEIHGVTVREQPLPLLAPGGGMLKRVFELSAKSNAPQDLYFLAWRGDNIRRLQDGSWKAGKVTVKLVGNHKIKTRLTKAGQELLVQIQFDNGKARLEEVIQW